MKLVCCSVLLAVLLSLAPLVLGFERSKFKTCEQSRFCSHHRALPSLSTRVKGISLDTAKNRVNVELDDGKHVSITPGPLNDIRLIVIRILEFDFFFFFYCEDFFFLQ
jgi:hypothetical protein